MILICSYCRKYLGEKEPYENKEYTHGMCRDCCDEMLRQVDGISFDEYLEGFDFPVVIVNEEGRIAAANSTALKMLSKPLDTVRGFLGGEALECAYARLPEGCGNTEHCPACTIRLLVNATRDEKNGFTDQQVFLSTTQEKLAMKVSTSSIDGMVRMVISEVSVVEDD